MIRFCFFLLLVYVSVNAQTISSNTGFSMKPDVFEQKDYGISNHNVHYRFQFSVNPTSTENKRETVCVLQIGKMYSKFVDLRQLKRDSIMKSYSHKSTLGMNEVGEMLKYKVLFSAVLLKDILKKEMVVQDKYKYLYQYQEKQPVFNWKLEKGQKDILGYKCSKATVTYRGRKYTAWYAPEIPINNGPYVFEGLPGLILELEDSENNFHFTAIGIDKQEKSIYLRNENNIINTTRDKFRVAQKSYYDNPGFYHGKAYNEDGSEMQIKSKPLPFNPIELE